MQAFLLRNGTVLVGTPTVQTKHPLEREFDRAWLVQKWDTAAGLSKLAHEPSPTTEKYLVYNAILPLDGFHFALRATAANWKLPMPPAPGSTDA